jgi:hypothetical protein
MIENGTDEEQIHAVIMALSKAPPRASTNLMIG